MPKYDVYITRFGMRTKRDRSMGEAVNGSVSEALYNVFAKSKERAIEKVKVMMKAQELVSRGSGTFIDTKEPVKPKEEDVERVNDSNQVNISLDDSLTK